MKQCLDMPIVEDALQSEWFFRGRITRIAFGIKRVHFEIGALGQMITIVGSIGSCLARMKKGE